MEKVFFQPLYSQTVIHACARTTKIFFIYLNKFKRHRFCINTRGV
ncbi:hypothetical protein [Coxiella burnetii]|uniref:Uncharacterized protein n=2 Tax=Coxiella burnetii TaxID=777 RepID=B5QSB7_COXBU|nr:hypothetical protein [Coxiella burnetii]YP_002332990.1 hypothetical protein CBU_1216a [Coxiella burnetii RSA 493]ACI15281.1 hypothetical protein CBU_1216a [Coxiella burnetii RSA 493]ACI23163.1 hypothetical protein CBUD_1299a [Coxiella burnetii Dugway 5J108-111]ACJ18190.1 hypothetical protein CbuG_0796 [Coxiella burnetii CbuG_Q212]AML48922.1 hypothetical protein AUR58_06830 [Coxiella burnetii]AML54874.1 hypothetical protein AYM38_06070 [Coxiella burnetii]